MEAQGSNRNQKVIATVAILAAMTLIVFGVSAFSGDKSSEAPLASTSEQTAVTSETNDAQAADQSQITTDQSQTLATTESASPTPTPSPQPTAAATKYKNGTYTASGSYSTPDSTESIAITVTVENDVITATSAQSNAKDRESKEYQADFISGYKAQVIGKALASLSLGNVSGSSLTPIGFNNAIAKIRTQAQS